MKTTLTVIKADVGSIGGHIQPSRRLLERVTEVVESAGGPLVMDRYISHTGDDIAILMTHTHGVADQRIHKLAWDAFVAAPPSPRKRASTAPGRTCSRTPSPAT